MTAEIVPIPQRRTVLEHADAVTVSVADAAQLCGLSESTIRDLIDTHADTFPWVRIGQRVVVHVERLDQWLADRVGTHVPTKAGA